MTGPQEHPEPLSTDAGDPRCAACGRAAQLHPLSDGSLLCWDCLAPRIKEVDGAASVLRPPQGTPPVPCMLCKGLPCEQCSGPETQHAHLATIPTFAPRYCWPCRFAGDFQGRKRTDKRRRKEEAEALEERRHRERLAQLVDPAEPLEPEEPVPLEDDPDSDLVLVREAENLKRANRWNWTRVCIEFGIVHYDVAVDPRKSEATATRRFRRIRWRVKEREGDRR